MAVSTVTFDAGGRTHEMRLSTRAGARIERRLGVSFAKLLPELEARMGYELLTEFFAACLNNGKGVDTAAAEDVIDELGGLSGQAGSLIGEVLANAFPELRKGEEAGKDTSSGNGKKKGTA